MKKILFTLLFGFIISFAVKAQEVEDMIVFAEDLDSCNFVRPDVMPKDFQLDYASLFYYTRISPVLDILKKQKRTIFKGMCSSLSVLQKIAN